MGHFLRGIHGGCCASKLNPRFLTCKVTIGSESYPKLPVKVTVSRRPFLYLSPECNIRRVQGSFGIIFSFQARHIIRAPSKKKSLRCPLAIDNVSISRCDLPNLLSSTTVTSLRPRVSKASHADYDSTRHWTWHRTRVVQSHRN